MTTSLVIPTGVNVTIDGSGSASRAYAGVALLADLKALPVIVQQGASLTLNNVEVVGSVINPTFGQPGEGHAKRAVHKLGKEADADQKEQLKVHECPAQPVNQRRIPAHD